MGFYLKSKQIRLIKIVFNNPHIILKSLSDAGIVFPMAHDRPQSFHLVKSINNLVFIRHIL